MSENMRPSRVPVVYLDTQDYSRFGDVLRGALKSSGLRPQTQLSRKASGAI